MRFNGELFFLMNGWMNFWALFLTARLALIRFRPGRAAGAALIGAGYALLAFGLLPALRRVPLLAAAALLLACAAYRVRPAALCPMLLACGLFLAGLCNFLLARGVPFWWAMALSGAAAGILGRAPGRLRPAANEKTRLRIVWRGRAALLPAIRDSGNLLTDPVTGLPVIVIPTDRLRAAFPEIGEISIDGAGLPVGFRLLRVGTAAGSRLLPCFHPDAVELRAEGRAALPADAVVALSDGCAAYALAPEIFFQKEGEKACRPLIGKHG